MDDGICTPIARQSVPASNDRVIAWAYLATMIPKSNTNDVKPTDHIRTPIDDAGSTDKEDAIVVAGVHDVSKAELAPMPLT